MEDAEKTKAVRQSRQVLKYVKVGDAWRFANIIERSGRVVRDHVVISGRDEQHTEGLIIWSGTYSIIDGALKPFRIFLNSYLNS